MAQDPDLEDDEDLKEEQISSEQKICNAIYDNDIDKLKELLVLEDDYDLNKLGAYGKKGNQKITPLHIAASKKNLKAVKELIKFKADVNIKSFPSGNTALHFAAQWAQHKMVAALLKAGANPVANNNKQKNPIQIIGSKYKPSQLDDKVLEGKMETQILLLEAGGQKADDFQDEIDNDIADAEDGLAGLKAETNQRIKKIEKVNQKKFDSTHPYLYVKANRMKAWKQKNKCTVQEYLNKKYIKVKVPQWEDKENQVTHIDLSKVASFQIAIALELLKASGLNLLPEPKPELPARAKYKKEKPSKKKK